MTSMQVAQRITADEYLALDLEEQRTQLIDGRIVVSEPRFDAPWPYPLPDVAVEIRSPSTWRYDVGTKKRVYEREGLAELWLVDGEAGVALVFRRSTATAAVFDIELELDSAATLHSPLLPGVALDVGALFDLD